MEIIQSSNFASPSLLEIIFPKSQKTVKSFLIPNVNACTVQYNEHSTFINYNSED